MGLNHMKPGWMAGILIAILSLSCLLAGCTGIHGNGGSQPAVPDPETCIAYWVKAVNDRDIGRLYSLSPGYIRNNVSLQEFSGLNRDNVLFSEGSAITGMDVLNTTIDNNTASIRAMIVHSSDKGNIPVWYNFTLTYEDGEWKVWTAPF